jgi:hypothetical protein
VRRLGKPEAGHRRRTVGEPQNAPARPHKLALLGRKGARRLEDLEPTTEEMVNRHGLRLWDQPEALAQIAERTGGV